MKKIIAILFAITLCSTAAFSMRQYRIHHPKFMYMPENTPEIQFANAKKGSLPEGIIDIITSNRSMEYKTSTITRMLLQYPKLVNFNYWGTNILHFAAEQNMVKLLKFLIEDKKIKVDIQTHPDESYLERTPLWCAIQGASFEAIKYLLSKKANLDKECRPFGYKTPYEQLKAFATHSSNLQDRVYYKKILEYVDKFRFESHMGIDYS